MKANSIVALILQVVGIILIVSSLVDYIFLLIPPNLLDRQWQFTFTTNLVDRGIIPMVGLAFLFLGYWIGNSGVDSHTERKPALDVRLPALLLSTLLGLLFLVLAPLHLLNVNRLSDQALQQINQRATQAESQINNESQQVNSLLKDQARLAELEKALNNPQLPPERKAQLQALKDQLQRFQKDPKALAQQVDAALTQLKSGRQKAETQAKTEALKLGLRTSVSGLLLSFGYIVIGVAGFRGLGGLQSSGRKAPRGS